MTSYSENTQISDLTLSQRTKNHLSALKFNTLGEVVNYGIENLRSISGFGHKCYAEIEDVVKKMITNIPGDIETGNEFSHLATQAYNKTISLFTNYENEIKEVCPDAQSINKDLCESAQVTSVRKGYSKETNIVLRHFYTEYLSQLIGLLEENHLDGMYISKYKKIKEEILGLEDRFTLLEEVEYFIGEVTDSCIQLKYDQLVKTCLSVRAMNECQRHMKSYKAMISIYETNGGYYIRTSDPRKNKTQKEIKEFYKNTFKPFVEKTLTLDESSVKNHILEMKFPFLQDDQRQFVIDFEIKYGYSPIFYIIYNYVCSSDKQENRIINLVLGFAEQKRSMDDVANQVGISRERVRQILVKGIDLGREENYCERPRPIVSGGSDLERKDGENRYIKELIDSNHSHYAYLFDSSYLTMYSEQFLRVINDENLIKDFDVFEKIFQLIDKSLVLVKIKDIAKILINPKRFPKDIDVTSVGKSIRDFMAGKYLEDRLVKYEEFSNGRNDDNVKELIRELAKYLDLKTTEDGIVFMKNKFEVGYELRKIIEENGQPMKLNDVFEAFKMKYPDHKYENPESIRSSLINSEDIVAMGKASTYALKSWNVFTGTIRDKIYEILEASESPLSIDEIYESVKDDFPTTNQNSLLSSMRNDTTRFVELNGALFGIVGKDYSAEATLKVPTKRATASQHLDSFAKFVREKHRFPLYTENIEECKLQRWLHNVKNGIISLSPSEKEEFESLLRYYKSLAYPQSKAEYDFQIKCSEYREYIIMKHRGPDLHTAPKLLSWYITAQRNYNSYNDQRKMYFTELLDFIKGINFSYNE